MTRSWGRAVPTLVFVLVRNGGRAIGLPLWKGSEPIAELERDQCRGIGLVRDDQHLRPNSTGGKWADAEAVAV